MKIQFTTSSLIYFAFSNCITDVVQAGGKCSIRSNYNCGSEFPPGGNTCGGKGCCCDGIDGNGLQVATCTKGKGFTNRGCGSCWGNKACQDTKDMNIGTNSCHGKNACVKTQDSTFDNYSCLGGSACFGSKQSIVGKKACFGAESCNYLTKSTVENESCVGKEACKILASSIVEKNACIGDYSCYGLGESTVGEGSCVGTAACQFTSDQYRNFTVGENACLGAGICKDCYNSIVPTNACTPDSVNDVTSAGRCIYCLGIVPIKDTPTVAPNPAPSSSPIAEPVCEQLKKKIEKVDKKNNQKIASFKKMLAGIKENGCGTNTKVKNGIAELKIVIDAYQQDDAESRKLVSFQAEIDEKKSQIESLIESIKELNEMSTNATATANGVSVDINDDVDDDEHDNDDAE